MITASLVSELRRRIRDVRQAQRALGVQVTDDRASSAFAELTAGHLIFTVSGGTTPSLDLDLTSPRYDVMGKLVQALSRVPGYTVSKDEDINLDADALDLEPFGPLDVRGQSVELRHHIFSDRELGSVLSDAVTRHNPSFTVSSLPPQEAAFVLLLAQASICRTQAQDAAKRKGLDTTVENLLSLATTFEQTYSDDIRRLARAIASPREANPNRMAEGDMVLGTLFRRSPRTGYGAPIAANLAPGPAVLLPPDDRDVEDTNVRVVWERNTSTTFANYELWMDFRAEVERWGDPRWDDRNPYIWPDTLPDRDHQAVASRAGRRLGTSRCVYRAFGPNRPADSGSFRGPLDESGQAVHSAVIGPLEPLTTYFFRAYVFDVNGEGTGSNVLALTTQALRCRFSTATSGYLSAYVAAAGTVLTAYFDTTAGAFTASHKLFVGEKQVTPTIVSSYVATFVCPAFSYADVSKDLTVVSPTELLDVRPFALRVTS